LISQLKEECTYAWIWGINFLNIFYALNVFFYIRWVEDHPDLVKATLLGDKAGSEGGGKQGGGDISLVGASEPNEARWRERQLRDLRKRTEHRTVRRI